MKRFNLTLLASLLFMVIAPVARAEVGFHTITATVNDRSETLLLQAGGPLTVQKHFLLENPLRLVVDLAHLDNGQAVALPATYQGRVIFALRFGQFTPQTSRIVMDLKQRPLSYQVQAQASQLHITLQVDGHAPIATGNFPVLPQEKPIEKVVEKQKPLIMIDAGHGGKDVGSMGSGGAIEKDITLQYALGLRDAFNASGRFRALLTRADDTYLLLGERVQLARDRDADLFISVHADANPNPSARGLSVYTLSDQASDAEAAALAQQENLSDIIGGVDLTHEDKIVADILIDLAQRETRNKSSELAEFILGSMHPKIPLLKNPHRYAGFRVLKAPDVPSVLVEIGFLTNDQDERDIVTREYQNAFTGSIVTACDRYFGHKE